MAHHGWVLPAIVQVGSYLGTFLGGIFTGLYGHVGKYSLDQANGLKDLVSKIERDIEAFENSPTTMVTTSLAGLPGSRSVRVNEDLSKCASELESKLELIRCYDWIRHLRLVRLPPKKNIEDAAELLPQLPVVEEVGDPQQRQEALSIAKKIKELLAY